jgi:hypothetical protein
LQLLEEFKHRLNIKLDDSEEVEIQQIDSKLERLPYESPAMLLNLHQDAWSERRAKTVEAYSLKRNAQEAIVLAKASNSNRDAWDKAYRAAKANDVITQELLVGKLRDILSCDGGLFTPGSHSRGIVMVGFSTVLVNWLLKATTSIDREVINEWTESALAIAILPVLLLGMLALRDDLDSYLHLVAFHRSLSDEVQSLALDAGFELGMVGKRLADSDSLIRTLMNTRDNEQALDDIECSDVPNDLCCAIGRGVLTDPVYSPPVEARLELKTILEWLKIRGTHPITNEVLHADDLKRDYELKWKADAYVDKEIEVARKYNLAKKALLRLSSFSEASEDDELADLYQHKFC